MANKAAELDEFAIGNFIKLIASPLSRQTELQSFLDSGFAGDNKIGQSVFRSIDLSIYRISFGLTQVFSCAPFVDFSLNCKSKYHYRNQENIDLKLVKIVVFGLIIFLITTGFGRKIQAQMLYLDSLYTAFEKTTYSYFTKPDEELQLDLFDPVENHSQNRPVILYVHGGGFSGGERDHPDHEAFLKHMTYKGYVTATMSYILQMKGKSFGCDLNEGYYLITGCNGRHAWNSIPLSEYRDEITDFVYHDVLLNKQRQIHVRVPGSSVECSDSNRFQ